MALNSARQQGINNSAVGKSLEKLSSGYRINRAGDDAAGLAISEKMRAQIKGLNAANDNSQDAISLAQTIEGGLQEMHSMLNRMQELATKSSNGIYMDDVDRKALQDEVEALKDEIDRIADSVNFNGIKLLDGSLSNGSVGGYSITDGISGTTEPTKFMLYAPEGYNIEVLIGGIAQNPTWGTPGSKTLTLVLAQNTSYTQEDLDNMIKNATGTPPGLEGKVRLAVDKSFTTRSGGGPGSLVAWCTSTAPKKASVTNGNGITYTAKRAGTDRRFLTVQAGNPVGVSINGGSGNVTLNLEAGRYYTAAQINDMFAKAGAGITTAYEGAKTVAELSVDQMMNGGGGLGDGQDLVLQIGETNDSFNQLSLDLEEMHVSSLGITSVDIGTRMGASASISKIRQAINMVSTNRGKWGAVQNRLEHTINNLGTTTENITAAESRIRDLDLSQEMMEFTKNGVLMQSAQAMLAQANQHHQSILQLLQE